MAYFLHSSSTWMTSLESWSVPSKITGYRIMGQFNLLWVVSSDNGEPIYPGDGTNNYPLKVSDWQGGMLDSLMNVHSCRPS